MPEKNKTLFTNILLFFILIVGIYLVISLQANIKSVQDSSVSDSSVTTLVCYKCTSNSSDGNLCESFTVNAFTCPNGSSEKSDSCASAVGGSCPGTGSKVCYKCSDITTDGNTCESFIHNEATCPSGSSDSPVGCGLVAGGSCPQSITCYKCTDQTNDGNLCQSFTVIGSSCPIGSSSFSTGCAVANGGNCSANSFPCGSIDINSDNKLTIIDLQSFKTVYGKQCNVEPTSFPSTSSCGPKDVNQNGVIDLTDYQSFLSRYLKTNCFL